MPALVLAILVVAVAVQAADPEGSPGSREALRLCHQSDEPAATDAKRALLQRGLALAEKAVASDDHDALAHFAVFCNVGRLTEMAGLGPKALFDLRRMRREIDRTLELAPDFADALKGKGALLLDTPRVFGGDRAEAERLLRRALALEPDAVGTRLYLARALEARGARSEARAQANEALALAEKKGDTGDAAEARKLLDRLRD